MKPSRAELITGLLRKCVLNVIVKKEVHTDKQRKRGPVTEAAPQGNAGRKDGAGTI